MTDYSERRNIQRLKYFHIFDKYNHLLFDSEQFNIYDLITVILDCEQHPKATDIDTSRIHAQIQKCLVFISIVSARVRVTWL